MTTNEMTGPASIIGSKRRLPPEVSILGVLVGIALVFEILGWIFVGDSFLANKQLALNFMKAYVASVHEMQDETAFVRVATQLAGIKPDVAQESLRNLYLSETIDVNAITAAAKLGPRFGFTRSDVADKVAALVDFEPLMAATSRTQAQLSGTPPAALKLVRR